MNKFTTPTEYIKCYGYRSNIGVCMSGVAAILFIGGLMHVKYYIDILKKKLRKLPHILKTKATTRSVTSSKGLRLPEISCCKVCKSN